MSKSADKFEGVLKSVAKQFNLASEKWDDDYELRQREVRQLYELLKSNVGMKRHYEQLIEFQTKFNQPVATKPTVMDFERQKQRYEYMSEELNEFWDAEELVDQADAMIDLIYLALGTLVEIGVEPTELFDIVHRANMSKLWPDGKVHTNPETGKVMKPPTFVRPEPLLEAEIRRQSGESGIVDERVGFVSYDEITEAGNSVYNEEASE